MRAALNHWSLQYRITAGVGVGLGVILALFGYVSLWAIGQATDAALQERQRLAVVLAQHVEATLAAAPPADIPPATADLLRGYAGAADGPLQIEILDGRGAVVAATPQRPRSGALAPAARTVAAGDASVPAGVAAPSPHAALLADLIAARRPGVRPHRPTGAGQWAAHVVAYAPLRLPDGRDNWGLTVEQPEDVVLSLPHRLRDRMLAIGGAALLVASALAWLDAKRVVGPLRRVTAAAQRIAAGDLSVPLADAAGGRRDEVGRLTVALDTMRGRLVRSLDEITRWNQELERRVGERTRELAAISAQHRQLLNKVIWAQEEERKRLARELHDETLQTLSGLAMTLQVVEDGLPAQQARERERLSWAKSQAVHAAREIRQLLLDLRPSALDDLGLVPAVRWYATSHLQPLGVQVDLVAPERLPALPPAVQTVAFRVLQEAIANVARHAHATRVEVRIEVAGQTLQASVQDDGRGFDPSLLRAGAAAASGRPLDGLASCAGLGLLGMEERVALLGGHLEVRSAPGAGTRVQFRIPLAADGPAGSPADWPAAAEEPVAEALTPAGALVGAR